MTSPATSDQPMPPIPRNFGRLSLFQWGVFLAVSIAVLTPLTFLVLGSFSANDLPTDFSLSELTLENYKRIWLDPETYTVFYNTVVYVVGATAFGISMAAILAWLVERTNVPGKVWIYAGVPMTLAMPGMLQAMAHVLLLSPRIGFRRSKRPQPCPAQIHNQRSEK
jgi:iron(III) transport system permease protein